MILQLISVELMPSNLPFSLGISLSEIKLISKFVVLHIQFSENKKKKRLDLKLTLYAKFIICLGLNYLLVKD